MAIRDFAVNTSVAGVSARATNLVLSRSAYLKRLHVTNKGAAAVYIHILDLAALPADGAVAHKLAPIELGVNQVLDIDYALDPILFSNGICIYGSSTENNKTIIAGADLIIDLFYSAAEV